MQIPGRELSMVLVLSAALLLGQGVLLRPKVRQPNQVLLLTEPSGASVTTPSPDSEHGFHLKLLGQTPLVLQSSLEERSQMTFVFNLAGHKEQTVTWSREQLRANPPAVRLEPTVPIVVPFLYLLRAYPLLFLWLLGCLTYYFVRVRPVRHQARQQTAMLSMAKLQSGVELGGYQVGEEVGSGATSMVFKARRLGDRGETLAFKVLRSNLAKRPEALQQFQQEVQLWKDLSHPHIVHLLDWGQSHDFVYLVCEFIEGRSLGDGGKASNEQACDWGLALVDALSYAHSRGIVHRDVKPDNLLLNAEGTLFLTDFGIARGYADQGSGAGTLGFAPPEQLVGVVSAACDYYALGATLFTLLNGKKPFSGEGPQVLAAQKEGRLADWDDQVCRPLRDLVEGLLCAQEETRLSDSGTIVQRLMDAKSSLRSAAQE